MENFKKHIPNILTTSRIITSILAPLIFLSGNIGISIGLYAYGAISDCLDGYTARKFNAFSELGRKLDAISDKLFAFSIILPSILLNNFYMLIPLSLELVIAFVNGYYKFKNIEPRTIRVGKFKTVFLFPTIIFGLAMTKIPSLINFFIPLLAISTKLQLQSIVDYINEYKREIGENKSDDNSENVVVTEENCKSKKDKLLELKDELIYYGTKDIAINTNKNKIKILKLSKHNKMIDMYK